MRDFLINHEKAVFGHLNTFLDEIKSILVGPTDKGKPMNPSAPLYASPTSQIVRRSPPSRFPSAPLNAPCLSPFSIVAKVAPATAEPSRARRNAFGFGAAIKSKRSLMRRFDPNFPDPNQLAITAFHKWYNETDNFSIDRYIFICI